MTVKINKGSWHIAAIAAAPLLALMASIAPGQARAQFVPNPNPVIVPGAECVAGTAAGFPCENVDLLAIVPSFEYSYELCELLDPLQNPLNPTLNDQSPQPLTGSDMWGWTTTDDSGALREFALQGLSDAVAFIEMTDPADPKFLGCMTAPAPNFLWRDLKIYKDHMYVVGDFSPELALIPHDHDSGTEHVDDFVHGLQIFDLRRLLTADPALPQKFVEDEIYGGFDEAHNIVIDEDTGFAAAVASDTCGAEFHLLDLDADPLYPEFLGCYNSGLPGAVHDAQCTIYRGPDIEHFGKEICLAFMEDQFSIFDMSDPASPQLLAGNLLYPGQGYVHQGWFTDDFRYVGSNDELDEVNATAAGNPHNTRTYMWDAEDLDNPTFIGTYEGPTGSIDHNMYFKGKYLHQANYVAGYRVLDASGIGEGLLTQVAFFDTHPPDADIAAFGGVWSGYFHFESGAVALSQLNHGELFILQPHLPDDPSDPEEPVDVVPESGRVHGAGFLDGLPAAPGGDADFDKVNFSFDARVKHGELDGWLKLKDKEFGVTIDAREITSLSPGGTCNGVETSAEGGFVFRAAGTFNGLDGAEFRVCGEDNGKHGKGNDSQPPDRFHLECTSGCVYDTADRTQDDGIDGGNIHLFEPIVVAEESALSGLGIGGQTVLSLDPMLADGPNPGQPMMLTASMQSTDGIAEDGQVLTLHSKHESGATNAVGAVSDALGAASFIVSPLPGKTTYWVTLGDLESNRVTLTSAY